MRRLIKRAALSVFAVITIALLSCDSLGPSGPGDGARPLFDPPSDYEYESTPVASGNDQYLLFNASVGNPRVHKLVLYEFAIGEFTEILTIDDSDLMLPKLSNDDRQIIYGSGWDIYLISIEGGTPRRLTNNGAYNLPVGWLPGDEEVVILTHYGTPEYDLWALDINTYESRVLYHYADPFYFNFEGFFSPDASYFVANCDMAIDFDQYFQVRLYDTATWEYEVLFRCTDNGFIRAGDWSSDGTKFLLMHRDGPSNHLHVYDLNTGDITPATWTDHDFSGYGDMQNWADYPVFSADDSRIYFVNDYQSKIWVVKSP